MNTEILKSTSFEQLEHWSELIEDELELRGGRLSLTKEQETGGEKGFLEIYNFALTEVVSTSAMLLARRVATDTKNEKELCELFTEKICFLLKDCDRSDAIGFFSKTLTTCAAVLVGR